jgi:hypothetical protein
MLREMGAQLHLALCLCERGHQLLARARPATMFLAEARTLASASHAGPSSSVPARRSAGLPGRKQRSRPAQPLFRGSLSTSCHRAFGTGSSGPANLGSLARRIQSQLPGYTCNW